jgi:hypothetical protein
MVEPQTMMSITGKQMVRQTAPPPYDVLELDLCVKFFIANQSNSSNI